ncbi:hypothetical protein CTI12_AA109980 [Artemisia annua]|uniref:DUF7804 domain-containing protein n=1 Tax=Artemisia annua TaxID=35608 RepID=A0A2U1PUU9_ARTAN|nr:hypothetical protein CTI12_AA109980 [Artemisia annua]
MTSLAFHSTSTSHSYSPYRTGPIKVKFNKNHMQMQCVKAKKLTVKSRTCCSLVPVEETESDISFDEWMRKSVTEIVKNIKQAPLLVQVYANGEVKTEKGVEAKNWPNVVRESPEGVILVEELMERGDWDGTTKAFGVLIQGKCKGRDSRCNSACYLLKTSSVNGGMGAFCTHFCLMKVRSFGQSASSQLNECWLLQ